ncbi:MAG TPA: metalloregulator ArsR/SmtB family transcription factor, partial [Longimicrobiales bacterium]
MRRNSSKGGGAATSAAQTAELKHNATRAAELLKAMSNPYRLMVLCSLAVGERSVGELERVVGLSQSALSQHLARLRREKIVVA